MALASMARVTSLFRTAALILLAYVVSELIYWHGVVPRLPQVHRVPLTWWLGVYAPFGLAALAAGAFLSSRRDILRHACVAAVVPATAPVAWSVMTGTSLGHDTELVDLVRWNPELWAILLSGFAMMIAMFAAAFTVGLCVVSSRGRHAGAGSFPAAQ